MMSRKGNAMREEPFLSEFNVPSVRARGRLDHHRSPVQLAFSELGIGMVDFVEKDLWGPLLGTIVVTDPRRARSNP
jgi:hypothetical protein